MLRNRIISLGNPITIYTNKFLRCRSTQSNPENAERSSPSLDTYKSYTGVKAVPASSGKLPTRAPLLKNFFVGKVDKELLVYPEVINRENMTKLQQHTANIKAFFDLLDDCALDSEKAIPKDILNSIRDLGLYGLNASDDYGGRGLQWSQTLIATEPETTVTNIASGLLSHRVVVDTLSEVGTDAQKELYLPKLANGSMVATEAIFEFEESAEDFFSTTAQHDVNEGVWILNGEKAFVLNGHTAGLFLVIAQTKKVNLNEDAAKSTTIFLVEKSLPGVKIGEKLSTIGCRALPTTKIQLDNVKVPESCVVGTPHDGNVMAEVILRSSRLRSSLVGVGLSKKILNELTKYCVQWKQSGVALKDLESVRNHISKLLTSTYAMESMIYLTAGLLDEFEAQDVTMESAVTKYYTLTRLYENSSKLMDVIGPKSLLSGEPTEVAYRNALQLYTQGEPVDSLRMYITLSGLQHSGTHLGTTVTKSRNPLFYPGHIFSKFLETTNIENPKSKLALGESLHPSLGPAAQCIEKSIVRLQMVVEFLLTKYGQEIVDKHIEIHRLTEIVSHIYAMFASTSRASRAYCIGLSLADHEMLLAVCIAAEGEAKVKSLTHEIFNGPYMNNDHNINRVTKQIFKSGGYFPEHPLTFNF